MNYEHFGIFLRELREARNLTREQLAKDICTPKQIYRIEKGDFEPSLYLLNQLSIKFNMDLNEYFKMYFSAKTVAGLEGVQALNDAIAVRDINLIKSLIEKYEKQKDFSQGENLQHICYAKAICAAQENHYTSSLNYCMKGIMVENPSFSIDTITQSPYSNVGLTILNCMSFNYTALKREDIGVKILFDILYVIENYILPAPYPMYQASQFSKKMYQYTLNNLSYTLLRTGELEKAEQLVEKGIEFSINEYNMRFLPDLIYMKCTLLHKRGEYDKAKEYYEQARCLYKITRQSKALEEMEDAAKEDCPKLFEENSPEG